MIAISEPVSRCEYVNEYEMTQHSLHAAVSIGLTTDDIIERLRRLCKTELPPSIENFIRDMTAVYGKVKMVIVDNRFYLETPSKQIYENLEQAFCPASPRHTHRTHTRRACCPLSSPKRAARCSTAVGCTQRLSHGRVMCRTIRSRRLGYAEVRGFLPRPQVVPVPCFSPVFAQTRDACYRAHVCRRGVPCACPLSAVFARRIASASVRGEFWRRVGASTERQCGGQGARNDG